MDREILDEWCERVILATALAILVLLPLTFGGRPQPATGSFIDPLLLEPFVLAEWLTVVLALAWVARLWVSEKPRVLWPPICWVVLAFAAYALGRYLTADIEYVARKEWLKVLVYAIVFFVVLNNLHRQEATQVVSFTLIFLAMTIACYAAYQFFADSDRVWHLVKSYRHRGTGTYICPNHLGGLLEMALPLGLAFTLVGRLKPLTKVFLGYASLAMIVGLVVSLSRGAWVASGLSVAVLLVGLLFHRAHRIPALILLAVLMVVGVFAARDFTVQFRARQLMKSVKVDDDGRFALWRPALQVWQDHPWFGAGPAHFDYRFRQYRPEGVQARPDRAHNDWLNALADWGIVGTGLVLTAWGLLAAGLWKTWRYVRRTPADIGGKKNSSKFAFVLGSALGLLAILAHSLVDFNMHIPANALVAVFLMALLTSHLRFATDDYWFTARLWFRIPATLVLVAAVLYIGAQSVRQFAENRWLAVAGVAPAFSDQQIAALRSAYRVEPRNADTARAIGEALRARSSVGPPDYRALAEESMAWFRKGIDQNPYEAENYLRVGWCLDWLDRSEEAGPYFDKGELLDPNSYFVVAQVGLHHVALRNYAASKPWFERSLRLLYKDNQVAAMYLQIVNQKLIEEAAGVRAKLVRPSK